ncbi:hypothetical protein ACPA9J_07085 [Pseudomonas aeruginosa]
MTTQIAAAAEEQSAVAEESTATSAPSPPWPSRPPTRRCARRNWRELATTAQASIPWSTLQPLRSGRGRKLPAPAVREVPLHLRRDAYRA